jgi:hypothetical protein
MWEEGVLMRRLVVVLTMALVISAMMLAMAMRAFADKGRVSRAGSCGLGKMTVHLAQEETESPGASEAAHVSPGHPGDPLACAGK